MEHVVKWEWLKLENAISKKSSIRSDTFVKCVNGKDDVDVTTIDVKSFLPAFEIPAKSVFTTFQIMKAIQKA